MWKELKEFVLRGNVVDIAVGVIIGAAIGTVVRSLVDDVLMPPIGLLLGGADFANSFLVLRQGSPGAPYGSLIEAQAAGAVTVNHGVFLSAVISFLVVLLTAFFLMRFMNHLRREEQVPHEPTTKECPHCVSTIPVKAARCAFCTTHLTESG